VKGDLFLFSFFSSVDAGMLPYNLYVNDFVKAGAYASTTLVGTTQLFNTGPKNVFSTNFNV
jgi:hypothetical protein